MTPTVSEIVFLVAIAFVWSRGSIFRAVRTLGLRADDLDSFHPWHPVRLWVELADCPLCSGVWIGMLGHFAYTAHPAVITVLGVGSIVGTASLATYGAIRRL